MKSCNHTHLAATGAPARRPLSAFKAVLAIVFTVGASAAAFAQSGCGTCTTGTIYQNKGPASGNLTINVTASVNTRCEFATAPSGSHLEPNFDDHAWTHSFPFQMNCTVPSRVGVVSSNGALVLQSAPVLPAGYTDRAPYSIELNLDGNTADANATCTAADVAAGGPCTFVGPAAPNAAGLLLASASSMQPNSFVRVFAPAYSGANILPDGTYNDTLTVTVSPAS